MVKNKFQKYHFSFLSFFSNAWVLAFIPAIAIGVLLPQFFHKYDLDLRQTYQRDKDKLLTFFEDVDQDGELEKIDVLNYRNLFACCYFWENDHSLRRQINLYGILPVQENVNIPVFFDVTNDGVEEMFVFTQREDSLFLNVVDFSKLETVVYGRFVSKIGLVPGKHDFVLRSIINHDYNHDGIPELYFLLNGCYSLYPRKILAYDFANDTIFSTINTGSQHYVTPVFNANHELSLISTTQATNNISDNFPYSYIDTCAWIFSFNDRLELNYEPIAFSGITSKVFGPVVFDNEFHYSIRNHGDQSKENSIISTDAQGRILEKKELNIAVYCNNMITLENGIKSHHLFNCTENDFFNVYEYNPYQLRLEKSSFVNSLPNALLVPFRIDPDNLAYFAYNYGTNRFSLFLDDFEHEVWFENNKSKLYILPYNLYAQSRPTAHGKTIMVTNRDFLYTYLLSKNGFYPFRHLVFILVYLLNVGFILLIQYLQQRRSLVRENLQKEISSLQLQLVNAQLDPHFTFNALNTVSAKILKGERFEAYDLMSSFSNMMRSAMLFSDQDRWKLEEELKFTDDYLKLMKVRFKSLFEFSIEVDRDIVDPIYVPRLLILNFAENAVKHAFSEINYPGVLTILASQINSNIEITITDNGIGREKAMENAEKALDKSGKGVLLNSKQVDIFNQLYKTEIHFEIEDLSSENRPCGTRVRIVIPLKE